MCSESFTVGVPPQTVHFGEPSSSAAYVLPHLSQLSPYCPSAPHFGHVPFTKRSGRNIPHFSHHSCGAVRAVTAPLLSIAAKMRSESSLFSGELVE